MNRRITINFCMLVFTALLPSGVLQAQIPDEPMEIGHEPQLFLDDWLVDNRFGLKLKNQAVTRAFHPPVKYEGNPVLPGEGGYCSVVRDPERGVFHLLYQTAWSADGDRGSYDYAVAYASSQDGKSFTMPELDFYEWKGSRKNNIVYRGPNDSRASGLQLLTTVPKEDMQGYRFLMAYRTGGAGKGNDGIRLVGSNDCIHWDRESDTLIKPHLHSDTLNSIIYDPVEQHYLMSCRAKDRYRRFQGETVETGASRRVAVLWNSELWSIWKEPPQQALIPDEVDLKKGYTLFYGMPMHWYGGLTVGYLWPFKLNDPIYTELTFSRDGERWTRFHHRTPLIDLGEEGDWDDGMVFGCPPWVEVGDEWWHYYAGHDDGHRSVDRTPGIGLAIGRKEGFISLTGPSGGGVVVTRLIRWPGGDLLLNLDASGGRASVRVSDGIREPIEGFNYADCGDISADAVRHAVQWNGRSLNDLAGQVIRLEILLENADLYALQAGE